MAAVLSAWRAAVSNAKCLEGLLVAAARRWQLEKVARALNAWLEAARRRTERRAFAISAMSLSSRLTLALMIGRTWWEIHRLQSDDALVVERTRLAGQWGWLLSVVFNGWRYSMVPPENRHLRLSQFEERGRLRKLGSLFRTWWDACLALRAAADIADRCGYDHMDLNGTIHCQYGCCIYLA